jgi:hypothetical protein
MCGLLRVMFKEAEATSDHPLEQTLSRSVDHGTFYFSFFSAITLSAL